VKLALLRAKEKTPNPAPLVIDILQDENLITDIQLHWDRRPAELQDVDKKEHILICLDKVTLL
jgi:hypothetical protein